MNDIIQRDTDEQIRATINGTPDSEWDGLATADVWYVLTDDEDGGQVEHSVRDSDAALSVVQDGGGSDPAVIVVELDSDVTADLPPEVWQEVVIRDSDGEVSTAELDPHLLRVDDNPVSDVLP